MAVAPNSLDPAVGSNPEALEADWLVYTPLLTYYHSNGLPGAQVIAGLASTLPTITDGGRTYAFMLRPGLVYSDGAPVRASDFRWAVERAIKLGWRGAPHLLTSRIVGAAAFATGRAKTISGISTDDATGAITIQLTAPWGEFENVLALPAAAPVPSSTPMRNEAADPPPGIGPYMFGPIVPGRSFSVHPTPNWRRTTVPGVPVGHVDVTVRVTGSQRLNALAVLHNAADAFDSNDRIPAALLPAVLRDAPDRYSKQAINSTYVVFMNVTRKPFSSSLARIAVQTALDDNTLRQLAPGMLQEGCFLIPPSLAGHSHDQCPRGDIEKGGNVASAKALVGRSGMAGVAVTVWGEAEPPFSAWMAYYTSLLNRIGFKARLKLVPIASYLTTLGTRALHPQTGFGDFSAGLPNPVDLYVRLTDSGPAPQGNENWGELDDPYLNRQVRILSAVPSSELGSVAGFWHSLELYVADHAYLAVFGYETVPQFVSDRLVYRRLVLSPVAGLDWTSFHLK
jgi:peptide/nickel transport system substrate-binding protein